MDYDPWLQTVPRAFTDDALWKIKAYSFALYMIDVSWDDVSSLAKDVRTNKVSGQLSRAIGSVGANIAEGYSRDSAKEKARFYEYALGSARERRHWYYEGRHVLGDSVVEARMTVITDIIRLLLTMVPNQRASVVKEERAEYLVE